MGDRRRRSVVASGLAGLGLGLAGLVQGAQAQDAPQRGGVMVESVSIGEPDTFDCHATQTFAALARLAPHYSMLVRFDPATYPKVSPDLADSWEVAADGLTYTFHLRPNVRFHDGTVLTSADVKATYDRIRQPPEGVVSIRSNLYRDISAIDTPDANTLVMHLSEPNAAMLTLLASPWNCVYSAAKLKSDPSYPARTVMGTGPFKFTSYTAGSEWVGARFDDYFQAGHPYLDGVRIVSTNPSNYLNLIISGQVMADLRGLPGTDRERAVAALGDKIRTKQISSSFPAFMLGVNVDRKPLDDVRVRQALSLAIDRKTGAQVIGQFVSMSLPGGFMRPGTPWALPDADLAKLPGFSPDVAANRAQAKKLLAEAGVRDLKLTMLNRPPYPMFGVFLADQFRQVGVTLTQTQPENARFFSMRAAGQYDLVLDGLADFTDEPSLQFAAGLSFDKSPMNGSRAVDRKIDEMYDAQSRELDPAKRLALVHELESYAITQSYRIPFLWARPWVVMSPRVKDFADAQSPYAGLDFADIWLTP